ncbi:hypothetical protein CGCA056_v007149 [Colletotrichum aenigma]|uniref:uncharacterized protein n=1 Tax=Colletotrichum aenigma TaxID=1215731 RepID=UPI0018730ED7|nr:uncharacterized protein CGCA056_v007149 [Colletotrichum aenigma]KAF5521171.1 hypothetical protein CGCA056_v007149 [Colletotrichum aenigma]
MPHSTVDDERASSTVAQPPAREDAVQQPPTQDQEAAAQGPRSSRPLVNGGSPTPQIPRSIRVSSPTESTSNNVQNPQYATYPAPPPPPRPQFATLYSPSQSTAANTFPTSQSTAANASLPQAQSTTANTSYSQSHALFVELLPADSGQNNQKFQGYIACDHNKPARLELVDLNSLKDPANTTYLSSDDSSDASEASTVVGIEKDGKGKSTGKSNGKSNGKSKGRCEEDHKGKKKYDNEDDNDDKGMRKDKTRPDTSRPDVPPSDKPRPAAPRPDTPHQDVPDDKNPQSTRQYIREHFGQPVVSQPYLKGLKGHKRVHSNLKDEQRVQLDLTGKKRVYFKDQNTAKQPAPSSPWVGLASVPQNTWALDRYPSPDEYPARTRSSAEYAVYDDEDRDGFYYGPAHDSSSMRLRYSNEEEEEHLTNFERIMQHNVTAMAGEVAYIGASVRNMENTLRRWEDASNARKNGIFPPTHQGQLPPSAIPHDVLPPRPACMPVEQQRLRVSEAPAGPPDAQNSSRRPSYQPMTPSPHSSQVGYRQTTEETMTAERTTPTDDGAGYRIRQTTTTPTDDGAGYRIPRTTTTMDDGAGRRGPQTNEEPGPGPLGTTGNVIFGLVATAWICMTVMSCRRWR